MKKLIYALFGCFITSSGFAVYIDPEIFAQVLNVDKNLFPESKRAIDISGVELSGDAKTAMFDKYKELVWNDTIPDPDKGKVSVINMMEICKAGDIRDKNRCYDRIVWPLYIEARFIFYNNSCIGDTVAGQNWRVEEVRNGYGAVESSQLVADNMVQTNFELVGKSVTKHCVNDVFAESYEVRDTNAVLRKGHFDLEAARFKEEDLLPGQQVDGSDYYMRPSEPKLKVSKKWYSQDVDVPIWTAYGLASEYVKHQDGKNIRILCQSDNSGPYLNCVSTDHQHMYTFVFKGYNNTDDRTITDNIVKGLCAIWQAQYDEKGSAFSLSSDRVERFVGPGCKVTDNYEAIIKNGECKTLSALFGLYGDNIHDWCRMSPKFVNRLNIKYYSDEYEYMTYAFDEIQVVLDNSLIKALRQYVRLQGIDVKNFDCLYSPARNFKIRNGVNDVLRCNLNGKDVDFVFDDLYESKRKALEAGLSGIQCLLAGAKRFDGANCKGIEEHQCAELDEKIPGGTTWDAEAKQCVFKNAAKLQKLQDVVWYVGGTAVTAAIIIGTGGTAVLGVALFEGAVVDLAISAAAEMLQRDREIAPARSVDEFIVNATNCGINADNYSHCSTAQRQCAYDNIESFYTLLAEYESDLPDSVIRDATEAYTNLLPCLSDDEVDSAVDYVEKKLFSISDNVAAGGVLRRPFGLEAGVMIGAFLISKKPNKSLIRFSNIRKVYGGVKNLRKNMKNVEVAYNKVTRLDTQSIRKDKQKLYIVSSELKKNGLYHYPQRYSPVNNAMEAVELESGEVDFILVSSTPLDAKSFGTGITDIAKTAEVFQKAGRVMRPVVITAATVQAGRQILSGNKGNDGEESAPEGNMGEDKPKSRPGTVDDGPGNDVGGNGNDKPEIQPIIDPDDTPSHGIDDGSDNVYEDPNLGEEGTVILGGE